jgi:hypothetical protein
MATNDSIASSTQYSVPAGTIEDSPYQRSKKAERLDMSTKHRFGTVYETSAVMCGMRGDKDAAREQHGVLNGREQISMSETAKKGTFGNTASNSIGASQTPAWGAAVRA